MLAVRLIQNQIVLRVVRRIIINVMNNLCRLQVSPNLRLNDQSVFSNSALMIRVWVVRHPNQSIALFVRRTPTLPFWMAGTVLWAATTHAASGSLQDFVH
jgi:hypothetical protein